MSTPASPALGWTPQLDGPDLSSPREEIEAELARVEVSRAAPDLEAMRLDDDPPPMRWSAL